MRSRVRPAIFAATLMFACAESADGERADVKIVYFETDTTDAPSAGFVHLRWKIENAESFHLFSLDSPTAPGETVIENGTSFEDELEVRTSSEDTTFKMIAFGPGGPAVKRVRIDVDDALVRVSSFQSSVTFAALGEPVTLSWITEGAREVRIVEDEVELYRTIEDVLTGSHAVTITEREHRFTLVAAGTEKTAAQTITVHGDAPPKIAALEVRPRAFRPSSDPVTVSWRAEGRSFELDGAVEAEGSKTFMLSESRDLTLIVSTGSTAIRRTAAAFAVEEEREPNDVPAAAQSLAFSGATGAIDPVTDVDVYAFSVSAPGAVFVETEDGGGGCRADTAVRLLGLGGVELGRDDDGGAPLPNGLGGCSRLGPIAVSAGAHQVEVRGSGGPYVLLVRVVASGCGNGIHEANESCDDGDTIEGDGCSAACAFEPVFAPGRTVIVDVGDHRAPSRTIAIDVPGGGAIAVHTETGPTCDVDLGLQLYDASGRMIGEDASPGCAAIDPLRDTFARDLAGGRHVLAVKNRGGGPGGLVAVRVEITERNP